MPAVFAAVERLHVEGEHYVREAARVGLLEDLQNRNLHKNGTDPEQFRLYLGPESARWWDKLYRSTPAWGMYVCPLNRANVAAFLHGYEYGAGGKCHFTKILGEHLAKKHRIKTGGLGWPDQIARLAERCSLDWMDVYRLVSSEVLSAAVCRGR